jgi:hypothetical protein
MAENTLDALRDYYDTHSTADEMDGGTWETDTYPNPMVSTSLRLPKDVLDWVRAQAAAEGIGHTALIRRWIEQRREIEEAGAGRVEERLDALAEAVLAVGSAIAEPDAAVADALRRVAETVPTQQAHRDTPAPR